jgi:hypothetical protein
MEKVYYPLPMPPFTTRPEIRGTFGYAEADSR